MSTPVWILGGACSFPSGPTMALADAAVRTQLCLMRSHPTYCDLAGVPARVSSFPPPDGDDRGQYGAARWGWLARHALAQLTQALGPHWQALQQRPRWLWVVMPETRRPGVPDELPAALQEAVTHALWPWARVTVVRGGHAAGLQALQEARHALLEARSGKDAHDEYGRPLPSPLAVVLAADASTDDESLAWLDAQHLLHGARVQTAVGLQPLKHGRIPGEGAAAVALVASPTAPGDGQASAWAQLLGCGLGTEANDRHSEQPCVGLGLSGAAEQAFTQAGDALPVVGEVYTDMNGEPYRSDEFGFATLRLGPRLRDGWQRRAPVLASADLHCASGLAHVALSAFSLSRARNGQAQLVLASSDDTLRGAALLGPADAQRPQLPEVASWR